eukprot:699876-Prymnesium_polylepis.1
MTTTVRRPWLMSQATCSCPKSYDWTACIDWITISAIIACVNSPCTSESGSSSVIGFWRTIVRAISLTQLIFSK